MGSNTKANNPGLPHLAPKRLILAASIAALFCGFNAPAFSADSEALIEKLREKGVLSEEEYQEMRTEARAERRAQALKEANEEEKKAKKAESAASELTGRFRDGFSWESGDKENSIALTGRIQADYRQFDQNSTNANAANTFDVRRAYIGVQGKIAGDWTFDVTVDVAQGTNGGATFAQALDVAWVNYGGYKGAQFRAGQFKMPMSIEEQTSSRFIDFTERSLVNSFVPAKERGAMIHGSPLTGVFYGIAASNGNGKNANETSATTDGKDVIGRLGVNVAEVIGNKDMVLHFAAAYSDGREAAALAPASGRTEGRGITFFAPVAFATDYDRKRTAAETSLAWNQFKLQGEWLSANFKTESGAPVDFDVDIYYAEAMWLITGEKYADAYRNGAYSAIKPNRPFKKGAEGWGAWEFGVRYSKFDAGDFPTIVGQSTKADATTVGLKWIPNTNTRVYLNYVMSKFDQPVNVVGGTTDKENAINLRLGLYF